MDFKVIVNSQQNINNIKKVLQSLEKNSFGYTNLVEKIYSTLAGFGLSPNISSGVDFDKLSTILESPDVRNKLKLAKNDLDRYLLSDGKDQVIAKLSDIYGNLPDWEINVYVNIISISSYSTENKSIMVFYNQPVEKQLKTIIHETNHLIFHDRYKEKITLILGEKAFSDIKESFTVLTNPEEVGYPNHLKLREYISNQHSKGKSIDDVLNILTVEKYSELAKIDNKKG